MSQTVLRRSNPSSPPQRLRCAPAAHLSIVLRAYRESDIALLNLLEDYDVLKAMTIDYVVPGQRQLIEMWIKLPLYVTIVHKETEKFMGITALKVNVPKNCDAELGIFGYAFEGMGLRRLSLGVPQSNKRAIALYDKIGFVCEGAKREALLDEGKWVDIIWMGMLETEYRVRKLETAK
ncbi:hypothetical protein HETIRDRAFT_103357 [Heterobasidion irregulare TC 32-1]|uniref:N-acetyltransferase domain-containing protein n=1 Tax=Heterobasidion irregulare (strain TC 32-1) TaxID=747525 RepID=W4K2T1_HETIT|nr:uncharacterized protein HETIRDRAFT_103357 [Heterobasidion irregulare TC 32-1]ETW80133.1 hypothetical protein HETIRDRAFT_103357 [Heterobasidion irregulare TC 32-1]